MKVSKQLWLGFGGLTVVLVLAAAAIVIDESGDGQMGAFSAFALLLILLGIVVAAITSAAVGRAFIESEKQLWASREKSEAGKTAMFESALDCIVSIDHEDKIIELNAAAERTFGFRREEVVGRELAAVMIPPAYRERHRRGLANYLATGKGAVLNQRLELSALRADGSEFPVELSVTRISEDGPPRFTAYLRDITERKRAEALLRESEERATNIVESIADGLLTLDKEWRVTYLNPRGEKILSPLRVTSAAIRGRNFWEELPQTAGTIIEDNYRRAMTERVVVQFEIYYPPLEHWFDVRAYPSRDGLSIYFLDITERKQAEAALREGEERLRFVMDSMPQKVFTATANGDVDYFNPQWTEFTGLTFEQIRDWGWTQFIHPEDVDENVRAWQHSIKSGEPFIFEHRFRRADGEYRWHISRALPMRDEAGRVLSWVGTNTDIHEQKQAAIELRQVAADMSEADRRKNEFLAMLAHELRNPLAPIRNAHKIVQLAGDNREAVRSAAAIMGRQIDQMVRLVDDLIDVSRISRGQLDLRRERVALTAIISLAVETSRPAVESGRHELTVALPPQPVYLHADLVRLAQVFSNLINNSCKYSDPESRISLTVEQKAADVVVCVKDSGVGIAPDMLPTIFEMFAQVDRSLERSRGGLGIGLTLVRRLAELHGGSVDARSEGLGWGSEFVVRLPVMVEKPLSPTPQPARSETRPMTVRRVLVVDDNRDSANSLATLLGLSGHDTHVAHDGLEAISAAATLRPDVVLLDIGMPKLNGYEAARRIRQEPWGKGMVLVALTGWGQEADRRKSTEAGFNSHMVKPVEYPALLNLLAELPQT